MVSLGKESESGNWDNAGGGQLRHLFQFVSLDSGGFIISFTLL